MLMDDKRVRRAFGAYIRAGRKRLGVTQLEASIAVGVTQSVYSCYESGKRPVTLPMALNICNYLNLDINDFASSLKRKKPTILPINSNTNNSPPDN